jgi:serine/threonine-protein kinase
VTRAVAANRRGLRDRRLRRAAIAAGIALVLLTGIGGLAWRMWPRDAAASARAAGGLDPRDIAVLYFADLSRDSSLGFLADGLTESLIGELGRVSTLRVVSANGVRPYRGEDIAADSVARTLRVGTVIDGSVEAVGDKVEVQIRLIEGENGGAINRAAITRPAGDLLALRDSLAATAASLIREGIGDEVRLKQRRAGTASADAWGLLQRAERLRKNAEGALHEDDEAGAARDFAAADSALAAAERLDPRWAEPVVARGLLAYRQARLTRESGRVGRLIEGSLGHAERALALEPRNPDALELRGTLNFLQVSRGFAHDAREAESLLARAETDLTAATAANPAQAGAWSTLSALHYLTSDIAQAKIAAQRAYEADAYLAVADAVLWRLFLTSYDLAAFADAEKWCQEGNRRFPRHPRFAECQLWIMTSTYPEPDTARAWALMKEWKSRVDPHAWELEGRKAQMAVAAVLVRAGQPDSARRVLERARATTEIDPTQDLLWVEAFVRTLLKENDAAIDIITRAVAANPEHREGLTRRDQWWWNDLRSDPRFQRLAGSGG